LDLTQQCTRSCPECPYTVSRRAELTLQLPFLRRLFAILGPLTRGLIVSGGEATVVPHFPETLALARASGFKEIAVISNGTRLHVPQVQDALLEHVTSVRVSVYDWQQGESPALVETLERVERLSRRARKEGSKLEIGAAMLTRAEFVPRLEPVARQILGTGVDWLYFHPYCVDWEQERPVQADQTGVLEAIDHLQGSVPESSRIQTPRERYSRTPLSFSRLHGAHFLIQVGADGVNYAGPECKYRPEYALIDLNDSLDDDFLWHPRRLSLLDGMNSTNYSPIGTRHRPPVFSDYIEGVIRRRESGNDPLASDPQERFLYPEII
jgi:hypothetical protein